MAFLRVLQRADVPVSLLDDEESTGKPLTVLGYADEARRMAESLSAKIKSSGCRLVVTTCPSSYDALKNDYPAMGVDLDGIEVLHASQYLDRLLTQGNGFLSSNSTKPSPSSIATVSAVSTISSTSHVALCRRSLERR